MVVTLIFLAVLIGGMVIGMPIAHALILTGVALMWHLDFFDTQLLAQTCKPGSTISRCWPCHSSSSQVS